MGGCLGPDTKVIMFDGTLKKTKHIKKNDLLMGDDSTPRKVFGTYEGEDTMYKIIPTKGEPFIVNGTHILCLKSFGYKWAVWKEKEHRIQAQWIENHQCRFKAFNVNRYGTKEKAKKAADEFLKTVKSNRGKIFRISVNDYLKKTLRWRRAYCLYRKPIVFEEKEVKIDPYILGHWLGDGNSRDTNFTTKDPEIVEYYEEYFEGTGLFVTEAKNYAYYVSTKTKKGSAKRNWYLNYLKKYDLINNKHIPEEYLFNSRKVRLAVLAGLIDSDGSNSNNSGIDIVQKNERLANDIVYLARSLGFWCKKNKCTKTCSNNGAVGTYYRMYISGNDFSELPLLLEYKRPSLEKNRDTLNSSFKIQKLDEGNYCGFGLDGNHKFLLSDFTVSYNLNNIVENA